MKKLGWHGLKKEVLNKMKYNELIRQQNIKIDELNNKIKAATAVKDFTKVAALLKEQQNLMSEFEKEFLLNI